MDNTKAALVSGFKARNEEAAKIMTASNVVTAYTELSDDEVNARFERQMVANFPGFSTLR